MGEHPNAAKMREAAAKFVAGDLEGFMATFSDDIVWRSGGASALSGTTKGKDEVAGWIGKLREFAGDTIDVEPVDVLADDGAPDDLPAHHGEAGRSDTRRGGRERLPG